MIRKYLFLFTVLVAFPSLSFLFVGCRKSIEDRAVEEAALYTKRFCPTPYREDSRMDSVTFDKETHTYTYYYTFRNKLDDKVMLGKNHKGIREALRKNLMNDTGVKIYKDYGFKFRYLARSLRNGDIILDETYTKRQYVI